MRDRRWEQGNSFVNFLFGVVLILGIALLITEVLPAQQRRARLLDYIENQNKVAAQATAKALELRVFEKARELECPVSKEDVKVVKLGDNVHFTVNYVERLNFLIYKHNWKVDIDIDRPIYVF